MRKPSNFGLMQSSIPLSLVLALALGMPRGAAAQTDELQASYDFLVRARGAGGVLLDFSVGAVDSKNALSGTSRQYLLPGSFYDTAAYWGSFVCAESGALCAVHDTYNAVDYQLSPAPGPAAKLQTERVNAHNGANIYDAAAWQIAVVLGAAKGKLRQSSPTSAYALASGLTQVLHQSGLLPEGSAGPGTRRAVTVGNSFVYNGTAITDGARAYAFRAMAPEWIARDPLMGSPYASWITASGLPASNPSYEAGKITWTDWKPITGENAWAFLIGPLQAAHLHYIVDRKERFVPFKELAVQNALNVLPAFAAMQSGLGGVYYAPAGTVGNEGGSPVNPHQVSVENNFSLYAGLQILRSTLRAQLSAETTLEPSSKMKIEGALRLIDVMIDGGRINEVRQTKGLLSFFKEAAWQNGSFVQGGLAGDPAQPRDWVSAAEPMAVDVQTWGIAALGAQRIDAWFGSGASFELWQRLKTWGAYGVGNTLWGVGYSDKDGNGIDEAGAYRQGVMSAEWTAGAINAVRNMLSYYGSTKGAGTYVASLRQDEAAMLKAMRSLRIDAYAATDFPGKPPGYAKLIPIKTKPYLYASRRHYIPFGWYANPLPSTASTAWMIMLAYAYDPFGIGGAPN